MSVTAIQHPRARLLDVQSPRAVIHRVRWLSATPCAACGGQMAWSRGEIVPIPSPGSEAATLALLACTECDAPPAETVLIPCFGADADQIEENFGEEMELIADVTLHIRAEAAEKVAGLVLIHEETRRKISAT